MKLNFNQSKDKTMGLRLSQDDYSKVQKIAEKNDVALQTVVSEIVHEALKEITL